MNPSFTLPAWTDHLRTARGAELPRAFRVEGKREAHPGAMLQVASVVFHVEPADDVTVRVDVPVPDDDPTLLHYAQYAVYGFLDVVMTRPYYPLRKLRLVVAELRVDPISSSLAAFRYAGREAGSHLLAQLGARPTPYTCSRPARRRWTVDTKTAELEQMRSGQPPLTPARHLGIRIRRDGGGRGRSRHVAIHADHEAPRHPDWQVAIADEPPRSTRASSRSPRERPAGSRRAAARAAYENAARARPSRYDVASGSAARLESSAVEHGSGFHDVR